MTVDAIVGVATTGRNNMPAFGEIYSGDDLRTVAVYITEILGRDR